MSTRPKAPQSRGFTLAEKRSLQFERVSLYAVLLVAVIAAIISFQAQRWFGLGMGLAWAAPLVPIAIDGFAIACSVGIVRSQGAGERARDRLSEWLGLSIALALSIAVNVQHTLATRAEDAARALAALVAASIPIVLAYGIHVYGRAMSRGLSAHVMADDPDQLRFDVAHLGDAAPVVERARPAAASNARGARPVTAARVDRPARPAEQAVAEARTAPVEERTAGGRRRIPAELEEQAYADYAAALDAGEPEWQGGVIAERLGGIDDGHARNIRLRWRARHAADQAITAEAAETAPRVERETSAA